MKIELQVCTLEQAKRLNELGVIQGKSAFFYDTWMADKNILQYNSGMVHGEGYKDAESCYSAFTVAELSIMLLEYAETYYTKNGKWGIGDADAYFDTQAEASADRLIYLLENNIITSEEINKRLNHE
jgi:hypothetical protein